MRGLTPRKGEWGPIAEMLESEEYDSAESLAKAVWKHAALTLLERDWYLAVVKVGDTAEHGPVQFAYGLAPTEAAAKNLPMGEGFPRMVLKVTSAQGHTTKMEEGNAL